MHCEFIKQALRALLCECHARLKGRGKGVREMNQVAVLFILACGRYEDKNSGLQWTE